MTESNSFHYTERGFTPKLAMDFASLMEKQAKPVYEVMGLVFPVIASSTLNFIAKKKLVSLLEIARGVGIPHQLAAQRVKVLLKLDIIYSNKDPTDKRKTNYELTKLGISQNELLNLYLNKAGEVFTGLDKEIGIDLMKLLEQVNKSFVVKNLLQRILDEEN